MFSDRRKAPRQPLKSAAIVQYKHDPRPRECTVTDLSETGVRLYIEAGLPADFFTLSFANINRRDCRVVWRLGHEIGAEFV